MTIIILSLAACGKKEEPETTPAAKTETSVSKAGSSSSSASTVSTEATVPKDDSDLYRFKKGAYDIGDHLWYGSYEQDRRENNGTEPIEWQVIEVDGDRMLLMSTYVLANRPFHISKRDDITWEASDLRVWLNDTFYYQAFSEKERDAILLSTLSNAEYQSTTQGYPIEGSSDTEDYVFVLSVEEAEEYLEFDASSDYQLVSGEKGTHWASKDLFALASPQAVKEGAEETKWTNYGAYDHGPEYAGNYYTRYQWTRSIVTKQNMRPRGPIHIDLDHFYCFKDCTKEMGVRPCMWVKLSDTGSAGANPSGPEKEAATADQSNTLVVDGVKITPAESANLEFEEYTSPDGYVSLQIPKGWNANVKNLDDIEYCVTVSKPGNTNIKFVYWTTLTSYESQDAIDMLLAYGGNDKAPISPEATTSSFFANSGKFFGYSDFEEIANLGSNGYGGDVLQGKAKAKDGTVLEGIFTSTVLDMGTNYVLGVNVMFDLDEGIALMTAPDGEFTNWQPVLSQIFNSIEFSKAFWNARSRAWSQISSNASRISQSTRQMSDSIMSSWEKRNNSYDIQSQQYSDATLGRERVYDKETGEIYYAKNGWFDSYSGNRYELVGNGSELYNKAVSGTISE